MDLDRLRRLLESYRQGGSDWRTVIAEIQREMARELLGVRADPLRWERLGFPEVVMGRGKSLNQLREAVRRLKPRVLVSRLTPSQMENFSRWSEGELELEVDARLAYHPSLIQGPVQPYRVYLLTGGTADLPVARECQLCLMACGIPAQLFADVGVAGLHRLAPLASDLVGASAVVVVAGMEASLATLVASITPAPVIAVPSSGGGVTPLAGIESLVSMLSSCVPGLQVVAIDSGVSAAAAIVRILRVGEQKEEG